MASFPNGPRRPVRVATFCATLLGALALSTATAAPNDRRIVLVTLDGVRVQEFFGGLDEVVAGAPEAESGIYEIDVTRKRFGRATAQERREALMPFLWKTLAPAGMVLGNQALGSKVTVRNDQWFSYPGYSEILTGQAQPEIKSNDFVRYPHETVLDYVQRQARPEAGRGRADRFLGRIQVCRLAEGRQLLHERRLWPRAARAQHAGNRPVRQAAPAGDRELGREQQ